jgi:hypothetical protein
MEALGTLEGPGDRSQEAQSQRQTIRAISRAGKIEHSPVKRGPPSGGLIAIVVVYAIAYQGKRPSAWSSAEDSIGIDYAIP